MSEQLKHDESLRLVVNGVEYPAGTMSVYIPATPEQTSNYIRELMEKDDGIGFINHCLNTGEITEDEYKELVIKIRAKCRLRSSTERSKRKK